MLHVARTIDLDARTLHAILKLRSEVFVVEQQCPYLDIDGRDVEPTCEQVWITAEGRAHDEGGGAVIATARVLRDADGSARIGRVCTAASVRGTGIGNALMRAAIERCDGRPIVLAAQSQLVGWYSRLGFEPTGRTWVEDGIPHTEMRRA